MGSELRTRAVVGVVQQTLNSKKVYVFGELLAVPSVAALRGTEHEPHLLLLEIFAYGAWPASLKEGGAGRVRPDSGAARRSEAHV